MKFPDFSWIFRIRIGKRMFDPYYQERTDPIDDIIKNKEKKDVKNNRRSK